MPSIREQLLSIFAADEPMYDRAVALGVRALPAISEMVDDEDRHLAAAAVYVAGQIPTRQALEVIAKAARRDDPILRGTAAGALHDWAMHPGCVDELDAAAEIVAPLLEDEDATVRRFARDAMGVLPAHN